MNYSKYKGFQDPSADRSVLRDGRSVQKTEILFVEFITPAARKSGYEPMYSLRDYENKGYPSVYQIYMNSIDERDAAMKIVGSMMHWRKLCSLQWFMNGRPNTGFEGIAQWRKDMEERDNTEAKRVLLEQCSENNVTAAKALNDISKQSKKKSVHVQSKTKESENTNDDFTSIVANFKKKGS